MKNLFCFLIVGVMALFLKSCADERMVADDNFSLDHQILLSNLHEFNNMLLKEKAYSRDDQLLRPELKENGPEGSWGRVAWKDAKGAYEGWKFGSKAGLLAGPQSSLVLGSLGGLLCGIGSSLIDYHSDYMGFLSEESEQPSFNYVVDNELIRDPLWVYSRYIELNNDDVLERKELNLDFSENALQLGVDHNLMLSVLEDDNAEFLNPNIHSAIDPEIADFLSSEEFVNYYNQIIDECMYGTSEDFILNDNDFGDRVFSLFGEVFVEYPNSIEEVNLIVNHYKTIIDNSPLFSDDEKEALYIGLSVAALSPRYWEKIHN